MMSPISQRPSRLRQIAVVVMLTGLAGCTDDSLGQAVAELVVVPMPTAEQQSLTDPTGIDLGRVPLFGIATARFSLENAAAAPLQIRAVLVESISDGLLRTRLIDDGVIVTKLPLELRARRTAILEVDFEPTADAVPGRAVVALETNAGTNRDATARVRVRGTGWFVGEPALEIEYQGRRVSFADGDGDGTPDICGIGSEPCILPELSYGNVRLQTDVTETVYLRNVPPADSCRLPPLPDGSTDCRPACIVNFARDAERQNLGFGFVPADAGFDVVGSAMVPFTLAPASPECDAQPGVIRGELRLLLRFVAGDVEEDRAARLVLESSVPGAPWVEIPLAASVRQAPVAVAKIANCVDFPGACSIPEAIRPLSRVYLEGTDSYDPRDPADDTLLTEYNWEVVEAPSGADSSIFDIRGMTTPFVDMFLPLAGDYRFRLHVRNDVGILSGISSTSDVLVHAIPDERMHIQLVWDRPTNDLDLHLVYADGDPRVFNADFDCFWLQCGPACQDQASTPCDTPVQWFSTEDALTGPNPRLDRDDIYGFGPENANIDEPWVGNYDIYVHYYELQDVEDLPTQVTVRLFLDGALRYEFRRVLRRNDLWAVARIGWQADQTVVTQAISDQPDVIGSIHALDYIPYPDGLELDSVFGP